MKIFSALPFVLLAWSFLLLPVCAQPTLSAPSTPRQLVARFQMTGLVGTLAFSADGRVLAASSLCPEQLDAKGRRTGQRSVITLWNVASGKPIRSFYTRGAVNALRFADKTASHLWSAGGTFEYFGEVILWNVREGAVEAKYQLRPEFESFFCLDATPDGSEVAVGSYDQVVVLDGRTLKLKRRLPMAKHGEDVHAVGYLLDGHTLVASEGVGGPDSIRVWDTRSGCLLHSLNEGSDGTKFPGKSGQSLFAFDKFIEFLDAQTLRFVEEVGKHNNGTLTFSPSKKLLFVGDCNRDAEENVQSPYAVRLWNLKSGKFLATFKGHNCNIWSAAFSSDERLLASGDQHGRINVWNLPSFGGGVSAPKK